MELEHKIIVKMAEEIAALREYNAIECREDYNENPNYYNVEKIIEEFKEYAEKS